MTTLILACAGLGISMPKALAQDAILNNATGQVQVDKNAIDFQTGPLGNSSNIPLPDGLPVTTSERVPLPVVDGQQAPNTLEIRSDVDYVEQTIIPDLQQQLPNSGYVFEPPTLQLTTEFNLSRRPGSHAFGEGLEVTVLDAAGNPKGPATSAFVAGDRVTIGPNGQPLPQTDQLSVTYSEQDTVVVRVLNIRRNNTPARESGVYFTQSGIPIVEDRQNGGDLDFDDGQYLEISGGEGQIEGIRTLSNVTVETEVTELELAPETRQEEVVETEEIEDDSITETTVNEIRESGEIEIEQAVARIAHASGVRTEADEQLVYNRYASLGQLRAGSDGVTLTGQLAPLIGNPGVPPTLLSATANFNPFVDDNEAGFSTTLGLSQFFNPTHRLARDMFGDVIENPEDSDWPTLLEPTGLFNNRRLVGYVPAVENETPLVPVNGIFTLPVDQTIVIAPANPQTVGRGEAAYANNVGGILIESVEGALSFVSQWRENEYAQAPISLPAGQAKRIIYALVPQQAGQALQVGETYDVTRGANGYRIADGGFTIIAADEHPENFRHLGGEVYGVEDTLPTNNAATALFNGIQGVYAEVAGGEPQATVDLDNPSEIDALVGNQLSSIDTDPGQRAYHRTTRAGGFYLGGAVSLGIGNQRDEITRTTATSEIAADRIISRRTINFFETPLTQVDTTATETVETIEEAGTAFFDIDSNGELDNIRFVAGEVLSTNLTTGDPTISSEIVRGEEVLVDSVVEEDEVLADSTVVASDEVTTSESDSFANVSPLQGELALGMVYNFGNTPWTAAANTVRAELFGQGAIIGQGSGDIDTGWRAEVLFHPFGERQRDAYQYDEVGNATPIYRTEPVLNEQGEAVTEMLTNSEGETIEVMVNQFVTNEEGDRVNQQVGTGRAKGPGVYLRVEDTFEDDESLQVAGGLEFKF